MALWNGFGVFFDMENQKKLLKKRGKVLEPVKKRDQSFLPHTFITFSTGLSTFQRSWKAFSELRAQTTCRTLIQSLDYELKNKVGEEFNLGKFDI